MATELFDPKTKWRANCYIWQYVIGSAEGEDRFKSSWNPQDIDRTVIAAGETFAYFPALSNNMDKRKTYDSDFCGSVPLNQINVIQSYGYILVLDKQDLTIVQASENVAQLLGQPVNKLVNQPLSRYVPDEDVEKLVNRFEVRHASKLPQKLTIGGYSMRAITHLKSAYYLLELEQLHGNGERSFSDVFEEIKYIIASVESAKTLEEVAQLTVEEIKKVSGFDGVMMYQFDADWNGTVIAEEKAAGMDSYLGHKFPASDIPKQARNLYLNNPYRLIPDRDYKPVRLYPIINPVTKAFIDLSDCNLRGVAAVHLEYLKNMNVQASMSIRILREHQLWGLIACHHRSPHYVSFELCSVLELLSSVISNKIAAVLHQNTYELKAALHLKFTTLTERLYRQGNLASILLDQENTHVLDLFGAQGAAVVLNGQQRTLGQVPAHHFIDDLTLWLQNRVSNQVYHTNNLAGEFDEADAYAETASGILAIPINSENGEFLICFRPERIETVKWGGNPNEAIQFEADGKTYHPRHSFGLWLQTVRQTAIPWQEEQLELAANLRNLINEFRVKNSPHSLS